MRKLGVFVVLFVFLSASQVLAAPNLMGWWGGDGVIATPPSSFQNENQMRIIISNQQEAPGGAVFYGTLLITTEEDNAWSNTPLNVTGAISLTNAINMTVSRNGETIAVLSGQYLGRAMNVVFQDLTHPGVTGAFSLKVFIYH